MLKTVKRKIRIHQIKKEATRPRVHSATMEDIQRKLEHYNAEHQTARNAESSMSVQVLQ